MNALASDALSDDQRHRILTALHGTKARDANLLTAAEAEHLKEFRALAEPDRRIVRGLISRLAQSGRNDAA